MEVRRRGSGNQEEKSRKPRSRVSAGSAWWTWKEVRGRKAWLVWSGVVKFCSAPFHCLWSEVVKFCSAPLHCPWSWAVKLCSVLFTSSVVSPLEFCCRKGSVDNAPDYHAPPASSHLPDSTGIHGVKSPVASSAGLSPQACCRPKGRHLWFISSRL
jgi:hypothetical protein